MLYVYGCFGEINYDGDDSEKLFSDEFIATHLNSTQSLIV